MKISPNYLGGRCSTSRCFQTATWLDEDSGLGYCNGHVPTAEHPVETPRSEIVIRLLSAEARQAFAEKWHARCGYAAPVLFLDTDYCFCGDDAERAADIANEIVDVRIVTGAP